MSELQDLQREIALLRKRIAQGSRHGVITDVKGGKVRMSMVMTGDGAGGEGQEPPHKSAWLYPGQHSGIVRTDVPFRKGQNVTIDMPSGDPRQARILPFSPNEENPRPIHAAEDAATKQFPNFDKDGKEEKDKDKPGFQRTESAKERTNVFDKISTLTQTKGKVLQELLEKVGSKAKSTQETTFSEVSRVLDDGKGLVSKLAHTAQEVLHKVGDQASHSHTKEGFLRQVGDSKLQHLADQVLHQVGGGSKSLLDSAKHLFQMGGHSAETSGGGTKFTGGQVSHDGRDIGGTHTHDVMTRFGTFLTSLPKALSGGGGGGGSGGGGGDTPPPDGNETLDDMLAWAWGGFIYDEAEETDLRAWGRQFHVTVERVLPGFFRVNFLTPPPYLDEDYKVSFGQNGPLTLKIVVQDLLGFTFEDPDLDTQFRVWFRVYP